MHSVMLNLTKSETQINDWQLNAKPSDQIGQFQEVFHIFTAKFFLSAVYFSYLNGNLKTNDLFILYIYMT